MACRAQFVRIKGTIGGMHTKNGCIRCLREGVQGLGSWEVVCFLNSFLISCHAKDGNRPPCPCSPFSISLSPGLSWTIQRLACTPALPSERKRLMPVLSSLSLSLYTPSTLRSLIHPPPPPRAC